MSYVEIFLTIPFFVFLFQMHNYAVSRTGTDRQTTCQFFGILFSSFGILALAFRTPVLVTLGLILIMSGLYLISRGLDRLDKKIYIDRFQEDDTRSEPTQG